MIPFIDFDSLFLTEEELLFLAGASGSRLVEDTATGNPVTFTTNVAKPLTQLLCSWTPTQAGSGDPAPDNVRPISGMDGVTVWHGGKNLFDSSLFETSVVGTIKYTSFPIANGVYTMSSDIPAVAGGSANVFILPGEVTSGASSAGNGVSVSKPKTITVTDGFYTIAYRSTDTYNNNNPKDFNFQLEQGSSVSEYEPYHGTTYAVEFPCVGKNLLPPFVKGVMLDSSNGAETTSASHATTGYASVDFSKSSHYMLSGLTPQLASYICAYNANKQFLGRTSGTTRASADLTASSFTGGTPQGTGDIAYIRVDQYEGNTGNSIDLIDNVQAMLNTGSTAEPYEPYINTVYGGMLDLTTGVLSATYMQKISDGSVADDWSFGESAGLYRAIMASQKFGDYIPKKSSTDTLKVNYMRSNGSSWVNNAFIGSTSNFLCYPPEEVTSKAEWLAYLAENPLQIVYELATPVILATLSPTQITALIGNNTIWSDANNLSVTYLKKG